MIYKVLALYQKKQNEFWQISKFGIVGIINTVVGYGAYLVFLYFNFHYLIAMIFSHIIGVTHSYFWNKYWTFKSKTKSHKEKFKFATVYTITFVINGILLSIFVEIFKISTQLSGFIALISVTLLSYAGHKFWSFKK